MPGRPKITSDSPVQWDSQIQIVFSVLVGLSFSQIVDLASSVRFRGAVAFLCVALFFVILDNWYQLFSELSYFEIHSGLEVFLYALALVPYAGLIFIVGAKADPIERLDPADWMGINLALICLFDALRMSATILVHRRRSVTEPTLELMGKYAFYAMTGIVYAVLFVLVVSSDPAGSWVGVGIIVGLWSAIRAIDFAVVEKVAKNLRWIGE
jgi:hypothetical protein